MILIDDVIISDEVIEKAFVCNLNACKGACCLEGDSGAPLEEDEIPLLQKNLSKILPYLTEEGKAAIASQGVYVEEKDDEYTGYATPLINGGACAFIQYTENGTAACGIEMAWKDGASDFQKPVSCHLYPVRIKHYDTITAVNYDEWDICKDACTLGESLKVPLYVFVKDALVRKFGQEFYDVLTEAAKEHNNENEE